MIKMRCVLGQKRIRGNDAPNITKSHLPRRAHRPPMMPAQIQVEPAYYHGERGVRAHCHEEEGGVFEVRARVDGEEDGEAGDCHGGGEQGEEEAVFEFVGKEGDDEGEDEGAGPGGHAVELGADLRVAVCADDAGGEEGVAVGFVWRRSWD